MAQGISAEYESARRANEMRYAQAMQIYNEIIARSQPGGAMEKAGLAQIEAAKTKGVGQEMQQMVSSGMYGTTTAAGVPARWEAEVGAPARLRLEDVMEHRLTQAQLAKVGGIERREDVYPDVGAAAEYERMAAQAPQQSLSDWMAQEFGTVSTGGKRATPPIPRTPSRPTTTKPTTPTKTYPGGLPKVTQAELTKAFPYGGPTPTFTTQPVGKVGPYKPVTYTPKTYVEALAPELSIESLWNPTSYIENMLKKPTTKKSY